MLIGRIARTMALTTGLMAASLALVTSEASAGDRHGYSGRGGWNGGYGYQKPYRHGYVAPQYNHGYGYGHGGYRNHRRSDGAGIALGVGALILGTIIATEAARAERRRHYD